MDIDNEITPTDTEMVQDKYSYEYFTKKLFSEGAIPITELISEFYKDFDQKTRCVFRNPDEQSQYLRAKLDNICNTLLQNPLWANCDDKEKENAILHMESIVTKKLYNITFSPNVDSIGDELLSKRINIFSWVEPKHLDLPDFDIRIFENAIEELERINKSKFYLYKIRSIINCLKFIEDAYNQNLADKILYSHDILLTLLIYIILKTNPNKLFSNVKYIDRYINKNYLKIEVYNLSLISIKNAITFIQKMSPKSLNLTPDEYEAVILEMSKMNNEQFGESNMEEELFNDIDRGNSTGSIFQHLQSIGSTIGSTIGSILGDTPFQGYFEGIERDRSIDRNGSTFSANIVLDHQRSIQERQNNDSSCQGYFDGLERDRSINTNRLSLSSNIVFDHQRSIQERQKNGGVPITTPFMNDQFTEEEENRLPAVDEEIKASLSICSNKDNMNED